jgi:choline/glycine/proline betaine transport protein
VLIAGPTLFLISAYVQNIGDYIDQLAGLTFNVDAYGDGVWVNDWTLFYWGWWISWSPFVGMFIARISRGRTIREFILRRAAGPDPVHLPVDDDLRQFRASTGAGAARPSRCWPGAGRRYAAGSVHLPGYAAVQGITSVLAIILVTTFFVTSRIPARW